MTRWLVWGVGNLKVERMSGRETFTYTAPERAEDVNEAIAYAGHRRMLTACTPCAG